MKTRKKTFYITMLFVIVFTFCSFLSKVSAGSYDLYQVKYKCPVRTEASDKSSAIKNGNDTVYVYPNQQLDYIKSATGPNEGNNSATWYAVKFDYAAREYTGYVAKACMYDVKTYTYNDDASFEESISAFPESYKPYLRKLHAMHPNWTFKADYTDLDWEASAEAESEKGTSAISYLYPSLIFKDSMNPNGIIVDGTNWYAPAKDAVKYYMDPRNFLTEKGIFMFQSLSYNSSEDSSVQSLLDGTFMEGTFTENGVTKTYAEAFIEAAKEANVSAVHLASRAIQEVGTKGSSASSGTVSGYEGYYNFYNIGATSGEDNYLKGLEYAKNQGWNSIQKAITGGAKFIGSSYISIGQDTIYFQKFNVSSYRTRTEYTHQYQTNIMAPESEASNIYSSYKSSGKLDNNYTFVIPVYNNRPDSAFKVSRTDTVGGSTTPTPPDSNQGGSGSGSNEGNDTPTLTAEQILAKTGYKIVNGYFTKITLGEDVSSIRECLENLGAEVYIMDRNWQTKVSGKVSTEDIISINDKTYEIAVYGDVTGDGVVSIKDLLFVQKYLLGSQGLTESNKEAADLSHDNSVTIKDLLLIQKYLLGTGSITQ
jgi:beta-N-acetylglucosaminidase